jgi:predicted nuclease with TOPRIM domain
MENIIILEKITELLKRQERLEESIRKIERNQIVINDILINQHNNMSGIKERLDNMENEWCNKIDNQLIKKIDKIETQSEFIKTSSENMNDHISFIESVYDNIRIPIYYILNKFYPIKSKLLEKNTKMITY